MKCERSPLQKLRDRQRCELAKSPREKCRCKCGGEYHGTFAKGHHEINDLDGVKL